MAIIILKSLTLLVVVSQTVFCQENDGTNVQDNSTMHTNATTANRSTSENAATTENAPTTPAITTSTSTESHGNWDADLESRLERSRNAHLQFLRQHVLSSLGWQTPPDITAEEKRQILMGIGYRTPVFVTRQKFCYFPACDLPLMEFPEYMNRAIWFDTSSRNIRYFFDIPTETDPNLDVTSAVVRLHLKRREDCPCAYDSDHSTNRLHIKIYQYRKPIRSHARLNHQNMRLIDARMVTWDSARWVNLEVTEAVKRVMSRGRRNGGFEVHVRDMEENVLDAKTVIDPTVCSFTTEYDCTDATESEYEEPTEVNYSPVLEVTATTTSRIDYS